MIFVISDFISDSFAKELKYLKSKHQIFLINISDIREKQIPEIGHIYLEDAESGEQVLVNSSDKKFQEQYSILVKNTAERNINEMRKSGIDFLHISNEEPFDITFNRHIQKRKKY